MAGREKHGCATAVSEGSKQRASKDAARRLIPPFAKKKSLLSQGKRHELLKHAQERYALPLQILRAQNDALRGPNQSSSIELLRRSYDVIGKPVFWDGAKGAHMPSTVI